MSLKKHGVKIFFGISCFLLALSLVFSAYSYARYVSSADFGASDVGTMSIDCEFTVNHGGGRLIYTRALCSKGNRAYSSRPNEFVGGVLYHS